LLKQGWETENPTILIMEGITYYLLEQDLKNILIYFSKHHAKLIADFGIKPECINEKNRIFGVEAFRKIVDWVGLDFVNFYEPGYFLKLIETCGFKNPMKYNLDEIQMERLGRKDPFDFEESGWISMVASLI
jgi:O-methyltransferase involved in polyketide biosynthesis